LRNAGNITYKIRTHSEKNEAANNNFIKIRF
jgi:hypothetical protein